MKVNIGGMYILGSISGVKLRIIRVDAFKKGKIKLSYFDRDKTLVNPDRKKTIKPDVNEGVPWVKMPGWYLLSKLQLRPLTSDELLIF